MTDSLRRVAGLVRKESRQIVRDPSSLIIAGVLPVLLLMIFSFGVSLDLRNVPIGLVIEETTPETSSFLAALKHSRYFTVRVAHHRNEVEEDLVAGRLKGVIVLPAQFSQTMGRGDSAQIQLLVDGSDPNTAGLVEVYVDGLYLNWVQQEAKAHSGLIDRPQAAPLINVELRCWFNPDFNSQYALLPGAVGIILTLIGTLLTSLVIAREWERGTMEALLATPVSPAELLLGKIIPYFMLGQLAMALAVSITVFGLGVPFHGSIWALVFISSAYLAVMLSLGLLISTFTKNQFAASQAALISAFLPAFELSGFIFEIDSMPAPIRLLTYVLPARYFVSALQTLFLAGDVASVLVPNALVLLGMASVLFIALIRATSVRLEQQVMWLRILSLVIKEFLTIWRDPKARFILLGPPVLELLVFSYAATQEVKNVRIAVLNDDSGIYARELAEHFDATRNFRAVVHLQNERDIAPAIDSRDVLLVVHIPQDFSRNLASGRPTSVQLILDGRSSNASQLLAGYAQVIVESYAADVAAKRNMPLPSTNLVVRAWFNPNLEALWSTVPALVAIIVALESLLITALSVARERELGTFEQLLVSPLSPLEIIAGKTIPSLVIGIFEGTLTLVVAELWFHIPFTGSLALLYAAMFVFVLAMTGVGLFVSSLALTQQQAILGTFSMMVPMMLLSGFASPVENMPPWLQWVTLANPIRHFIAIVKGVFLKSVPPVDILQNLVPLMLISVATLSAATWLFRKRME